jgi:DNA polymerase III subunit delta'
MKFSEIPGQSRMKNQLLQTVSSNRVSHAQLFFGPAGCGKLALAIAYAQYINCENRKPGFDGKFPDDSCGFCASCIKYNKFAHPDLHFFYPTAATKEVKKAVSKEFLTQWRAYLARKNFLVELSEWFGEIGLENKQGIINAEDCNEIIKILGYKAYESEYKVVIIWYAEKLFHAAAPKILKILEEPPEKTLFLLVSENMDQILNTILSRTQIVKIPKLSDREVVQALMELHCCTEIEARRIAVLCDGNLHMAMSLVNETGEEDHNFAAFRNWLRLCYKPDVVELTRFAEEMSKSSRESQKSLLSYALRTARHCLLVNYNMSQMVKLESDEKQFVQQLSPFINPANGDVFAQEFNSAIFHLERNANSKILFMDLSLKMVNLLKTAKA